jgi:hypothetical protein
LHNNDNTDNSRNSAGQSLDQSTGEAPTDATAAKAKPSLFVNHQFTSHFEGWTEEESEPLLRYLLRQAIDPR